MTPPGCDTCGSFGTATRQIRINFIGYLQVGINDGNWKMALYYFYMLL